MSNSEQRPIDQPIRRVLVWQPDYPAQQIEYEVGYSNVTRIEATEKSGEYSFIPYIRVWADNVAVAEFCQHKCIGIWFAAPAPAAVGKGEQTDE